MFWKIEVFGSKDGDKKTARKKMRGGGSVQVLHRELH